MYKNKVPIPPLIMQDDTLTISTCGTKTKQINSLVNTRAIIMGLQFGKGKCVKMHIGKNHNSDLCGKGRVDYWEDKVVENEEGHCLLEDVYAGEVETETVDETKYLGSVISSDVKNDKNIKDKTNKAQGNVNKIVTSLKERPYGKFTFRAAQLMRNGMLIGAMLNNSETWVNVNKSDTDKLDKPDKHLSEKLFETKCAKAFTYLEMGILPVKFVIMAKRLKFLKHILEESMDSLIRQVYETQKMESRKGDFVYLTKEDLKVVELEIKETEIAKYSNKEWSRKVNEQVEKAALKELLNENREKLKTKHLEYKFLEIQSYLKENKNTELSKVIFQIRSGTFDIKAWKPWKYGDNLCVMCQLKEENIYHFFKCESYKSETINYEDIYENNADLQVKVAKEAKKRQQTREIKLQEVGQDSLPAPDAPDFYL